MIRVCVGPVKKTFRGGQAWRVGFVERPFRMGELVVPFVVGAVDRFGFVGARDSMKGRSARRSSCLNMGDGRKSLFLWESVSPRHSVPAPNSIERNGSSRFPFIL